ncbi:MAG: DNA topoisomerase I [Candidatus Taylorbacteria bacterium RIFCSPLOWO2_12_FULL_43_20]|uniref:DNA topoisomerase 1 n=1 Tax=Candidatus Taylorbacteria bacterium RIFCSPLOWO2_12_FULL_43_20 TaxID=1802332 RepID=A0A1G2P1Y2_9BACT|nr:MAG: DNA topoisomerase I [Candidatus Taylorbacteria bacterium RIFCSPHIGHO2_01_FULL_43_120]OHA23410.1 MAG: DNA topoisomerase I [Candidatus Taylorbacteria bacterium RIFCSPHIGHO2_02_FULL_43_55]OHA29542.1 MAG: DNA topoisomerase I [Candidatus Taylorbacteria bacterium RIFCSPHIGHO2_12_FULL_42_34]OHA31346.1 MAG: DNA topoisomerase I [Candidatus Taylorbacteria bacterium RIFCSPLOWO2_01_FULL_43_83]OHA38866.1 MAG: DNA topoisomerase I [Candidatus Taylorbacteria bacterium RIFCSPLOWO2_02_FULL_43_22b]OHA423
MAKKLLIVESPAKAKTISKYLGDEYTVKASVGHIRDLPKSNKKAIDIEAGFVPHYEISPGKEKVVAEIKMSAGKASEILLATDPDREGEAIAWHISSIITDKDGDAKSQVPYSKIKRITYHEITKEAIHEALANPRSIDENLRKAQEARRVLDRLVGYDLSGLIWKKVRYGLSAGRVQSPALRILMEREREIRAFISHTFWIITANTKTKKGEDIAFICEKEPTEKSEVDKILKAGNSNPWTVKEVKESEAKRDPRAPFITSTLQQAASSRLGYAPARTMSLAQRLYEAGLITYMRTDSTNLSQNALGQIYATISNKYGKEFLSPRVYAKKSKNAQEAHEAIRPTTISRESAGANEEQKKLYRLIWQRTVASQMASAKTLRTKISAGVNTENIPDFAANGSRVLFPGWLSADPDARGEDVELPKVAAGDRLDLISLSTDEKETQPPPRYTEAGLIKELEKRGIGRPSTYASIIKTIEDRGYVEKINKSLKPTDTGDVVSTFLENNFTKYVSDTFTAEMEDELDEIAEGRREYVKTLTDFYKPFLKEVKSKEKMEKITNLGDAPEEFKCPLCGGPMIVKLGKTGKFLSCAKFPECTGARTFEGKELSGPKVTGEPCPECGGKLVEREGRFGKFISCDNYPKCKFIKKDAELERQNSTGVSCPICKEGVMTERKGRFGIFYSCSNYPKCKNAIKAKPTGNICDLCGSLMMEGTKTIPERCSNKTCLNHRPDKIAK